jgi:hypothetical protein
MLKPKIAGLFAVGLLLLFAGIGWSELNRREDDVSGPPSGGRSSVPIGEAWERLARRGESQVRRQGVPRPWPISLMRGRPSVVPARTRVATLATLGKPEALRLRFDSAWYAKTRFGRGIWAVRGRGVVCIVHAVTGAAACNTSTLTARNGVTIVTFRGAPSPNDDSARFLALGMAPDWASAVRLRVGGVSRIIPIADNVYALRAKSPVEVETLIP